MARSLALADALVGLGAAVTVTFPDGAPRGEAARHLARLGIAETPIPADAVVVADLPQADEATALASPERLVVLDDRDAFSGSAAIVVQPSQPEWSGRGRPGRVLAGYEWMAIASRYRELREPARIRPDAVPEIVLCFGGSDPARVTERIGPVVAERARAEGWVLEAIVGAGHLGADDLPGLPLVRDPGDLPERLARADVVVVGAGIMKFEAACLGRPAVLVGVSDDQLPVGPVFASTGAAVWVGDGRTMDPSLAADAISALVADPERRRALGERGAAVVDGRGADRLADAILALATATATAGASTEAVRHRSGGERNA
ncbi:MAG TPA: hypothetical protein VGO64_11965 [Candidatus Limnocylindrales bacterium]|nr:hypothetical protein [Candidatus Limnocylindrales bacterium]